MHACLPELPTWKTASELTAVAASAAAAWQCRGWLLPEEWSPLQTWRSPPSVLCLQASDHSSPWLRLPPATEQVTPQQQVPHQTTAAVSNVTNWLPWKELTGHGCCAMLEVAGVTWETVDFEIYLGVQGLDFTSSGGLS